MFSLEPEALRDIYIYTNVNDGIFKKKKQMLKEYTFINKKFK